jgi:8-oxo-dGTP pyrophosphatase MutT (NUDIX family)
MQTLDSRIVYRNRWMRVREDKIRRADGSEGIYGVVEKPDAALIIPIEQGRVHLVQQYRYPAGGRYWEFPQGTWEQESRYSIENLARGELREETGLEAEQLEFLGRIHIAYGFLAQVLYVFLARGLRQGEAVLEPEEQDLVCGCFGWSDFHAMVESGEIADAQSLAALALLMRKRPELVG